jgi:hypothetical protein
MYSTPLVSNASSKALSGHLRLIVADETGLYKI